MIFSSLHFSFKRYIWIFNEDLNTLFSIKINYNINNQYFKFNNSNLFNNNFDNLFKFLFILNSSLNYTFLYKKYKFINLNLYFLDNLLIFNFIMTFDNFLLRFTKLSFLFEHFTTIYNVLRFDSKYSFVLLTKK